ncbi:hypothetical protein ABW19_dt0202339 [Dactylella cylindrospora]|nr:hypothetical protein ABW19_dt0202339 [Dactylella cylindrospora]
MPSESDDNVDIGQTYQDLVRAEQTASELEARLDNLDSQLEALIQASNIPPELFDADDETLKRIFDAATANAERRAAEEGEAGGEEKNSGSSTDGRMNGETNGERKS